MFLHPKFYTLDLISTHCQVPSPNYEKSQRPKEVNTLAKQLNMLRNKLTDNIEKLWTITNQNNTPTTEVGWVKDRQTWEYSLNT